MEITKFLKGKLSKKKRKHSKQVSDIMAHAQHTIQQRQVAMLHDVLEAGKKKEQKKLRKEIKEKFGKEVLNSVTNLTTTKSGKKKQKEMEKKMLTMPDHDVEVKLADRISNIMNRTTTDKYKKKTMKLVKAVEARDVLTANQKDAIGVIKSLFKKRK